MVLRAVDEGRAVHLPKAGADEDELAEEWSPEELSSAAMLASSVLAKHGTGQVSRLGAMSLSGMRSCYVVTRMVTLIGWELGRDARRSALM